MLLFLCISVLIASAYCLVTDLMFITIVYLSYFCTFSLIRRPKVNYNSATPAMALNLLGLTIVAHVNGA